ncbi:MAG: DUF885 domain-containing protein [Treponema sp.]|nr:DUF885 domain-containing protein [Treponema sp.]
MKDPKLVRKYRVLDQDIAAWDDKLTGVRSCETRAFIPTLANKKMMQADLDSLIARQKALDAPDPVFSLIKDHYGDFLEGLQQNLNNTYKSPLAPFGFSGFNFSSLLRRDTRPEPLRKEIIETRMAQYEDQLSAIFEWIGDLPVNDLNSTLTRIGFLRETIGIEKEEAPGFFVQLSKDQVKDLTDKMQSFSDNILGKWAGKLEKLIAEKGGVAKSKAREESETIPLDKDAYRAALKNHGVDLDEIISWHEAEVEKTRSECFDIANKLDIPEKPVKTMTEVNDILFKYAGPADSPEEMFKRANEYVTRGTAAAREYVWLPEDADCPPMPMYKQMRASYPWGAGGSASPYSRPFKGRFMLNDENYKAVTDGWIKINCTHEVHPGHYTQFIRSLLDPMPETFKRGAKHTCLTEGMCIRTEKLLEYIFAEDPFYPLFTAYRRHHTSVRIKVDLWLRYFGKTIGDVIELYINELGFDRKTARAQVQAHENMHGYFTTYYYGYKKVAEWEKFYGFDKKEYTEFLFSAGRISLDTFRRYLELSEADRYSLLHEFASLNQFR